MDHAQKKILIELIKKVSVVNNEDEIALDADLFNSGYLDSFTIINLVQHFEDKFDIVFNYNDVQEKNFKTLNAIIMLLESEYKL